MRGTADLLGHEDVLRRLWGALERDALHHAYLFEGPEGVGKKTVAVRLAMAANCTGPPGGRPCGVCPTCRQIQAGTHPDVVLLTPEADSATPIVKVDQVREIVRLATFHRYSARRRFILVDPAEALPPAAANALLKTLEEPPAGTGFILIATHAPSLLPTIRSRCQRVRFSAVDEAVLVPWLAARDVADPTAVARGALGCPGRALRMADGELDDRRALRDALLAAIAGQLGELFDWSAKRTANTRADWRPEVEQILDLCDELLRDATVHGAGGSAALLHADRADVVAAWSRALYPGGVTRCAAAVVEAREQLERNVSGKTLLDALLTSIATELGAARRAGR